MKKIAIAVLVLMTAGCSLFSSEVDTAPINPDKIKWTTVMDGNVRLRCTFFTGSGEGSGSAFCYKVDA